jgi:hypothetical protein
MPDVIIRFPGRLKPAPVQGGNHAEPAQILFFTGVRYEREGMPNGCVSSNHVSPTTDSPNQDSPNQGSPTQGNGQRRRRRG